MSDNTHPLRLFLRRTFRPPFARLVLAGYGNAPGARIRPLRVPPKEAGDGPKRIIELTSGNPLPSGNDPLVLAALLKLLLARPELRKELEFSTSELLAELGWEETALMQRGVDHTLEKYATLVYFRYEEGRREVFDGRPGEWGFHSLITLYGTQTGQPRGRARGKRLLNLVVFADEFVGSLARGRIFFADTDFGALRAVRA